MPKCVRCSMQPRVLITCLDNPAWMYTFQFYRVAPTRELLHEAIGMWGDLYAVGSDVVETLHLVVANAKELNEELTQEVCLGDTSTPAVRGMRFRVQVLDHALVFEVHGEGELLTEKDALPHEL